MLIPILVAIWVHNYSVYGRRKLTKAARKAGHRRRARPGGPPDATAGHPRGVSRAKKRFTTHSDPSALRAPDLVKRDFTATGPNQKWVCDFTYCSTWSGVVYVAFVTDVFSRRIVGWKAARSMSAPLVIDALNMAAWTRRALDLAGAHLSFRRGVAIYVGCLHRPTRRDRRRTLDRHGRRQFDNAMAESVIALFKTELHRNPAVLTRNGGHWKASTTSRSRPAGGSHGSTPNASTANSVTSPQPRSRRPTTVKTLRPSRPEPPTGIVSVKPRPNHLDLVDLGRERRGPAAQHPLRGRRQPGRPPHGGRATAGHPAGRDPVRQRPGPGRGGGRRDGELRGLRRAAAANRLDGPGRVGLRGHGRDPLTKRIQSGDGLITQVSIQASHAFTEPGTYFPTLRITSLRQGRPDSLYGRILNLARVRVVVG